MLDFDRVDQDIRRYFARPFPGTERSPNEEDEAHEKAVQEELDRDA